MPVTRLEINDRVFARLVGKYVVGDIFFINRHDRFIVRLSGGFSLYCRLIFYTLLVIAKSFMAKAAVTHSRVFFDRMLKWIDQTFESARISRYIFPERSPILFNSIVHQ